MEQDHGKGMSRRDYLTTTAGAATVLAASALALPAEADSGHDFGLYGHGMVWNPALPGVAGEVKLQFDIWVDLEAGHGHGVVSDPLHPDWECYFAISNVWQGKEQKDTLIYKMWGAVTMASAPTNVGLQVRIYARARGESTEVGIALADLAFGGTGIITNLAFRSTSSVIRTVTAI